MESGAEQAGEQAAGPAHCRGVVPVGACSLVAGSLTPVTPLRLSSMISAPAAARAERDVR